MYIIILYICALALFHLSDNLVYFDGQPYFKTYGDAVWDLYVLVTTANDPDVM